MVIPPGRRVRSARLRAPIALAAAWLGLAVAFAGRAAEGPPPELTIAFLGDQGLDASARAVLQLIRDEGAYRARANPDWVSGACMLVRRSAFEKLGGLDEGFFMYCEDTDLCKRLRGNGYSIVFEPRAEVMHEGGASSPPGELLPVLAASRLRYAAKHRGRGAALLERIGVGLGALTHAVVGRGGHAVRAGYARALRTALAGSADT